MKVTLSVLKADIGSIGGHLIPSKALLDEVINFVKKSTIDKPSFPRAFPKLITKQPIFTRIV